MTLVADIEFMYHQVLVDQDRKYLKFLWWPSGNTNLPPAKYCMKVHVFGAESLPACVTYALQQTAIDNEFLFLQDVIATVLENFYMDDRLKSVDSAEEAIRMSDELSLCYPYGRCMGTTNAVCSTHPAYFDGSPKFD